MRITPLVVVLVACGNSGSSLPDGGANDATIDDAHNTDATADAGVDVAEDAAEDTSVQDSADNDSDDSSSFDATYDGPMPFACGTLLCDPLEYCTISHGLVYLDGGGVYTGYACTALPSKCLPVPACSCLKTVGPCTCADNSGDLTVTCYF
jgi:hypothetical protein